jgi:endo-1,4-beta-D-glucanase Y
MSTSDAIPSLLTALLLLNGMARADLTTDWTRYRQAFVQADGRVVDTGNGGVSHSEGQAFAMLLATGVGDRETFDRVWRWTREHLAARPDGLFAWKWQPGSGVVDNNNAADGDLLLSWALLRAQRSWPDGTYGEAGRDIAAALRKGLLRGGSHGTVLLPGAAGFEHEGVLTVNLSYWVFPALRDLVADGRDPVWRHLLDDGLNLLSIARFGRWGLPPDWLALRDTLTPADGFEPRFGYDAVRIPLYLIWAGLDTPERLQPFRDYWGFFRGARFLPPWTDLTMDSVASHDAPAGIRAIARLATEGPGADLPGLDDRQDYYSASLLLLAKLAQRERSAQ